MTEFYDHVMEESRVISKIVSHQVAMRPMTSDEHKLYEAPLAIGISKCVITIT